MPSIAAQRNTILALLLILTAASWMTMIWQAGAGGTDAASMSSPTMGMAWPLFLAIWVIMMVAMMFPTAAPMILVFHRIQTGKRQQRQSFVATWVFTSAYLVVWSASGVIAYGGAVLAEAAANRAGLSGATAARIGGGVLILAGLYRLTPLKDRCLAKCRTPVSFIMTSWRDGTWGAVRMGLEHGAWCLGCCWLLFVILFPLGMMNITAMAMITLLVFAEKSMPFSSVIVRAAGGLLIAYGVVVLATPGALPTYMGAEGMVMQPTDGLTSAPTERAGPPMPTGTQKME